MRIFTSYYSRVSSIVKYGDNVLLVQVSNTKPKWLQLKTVKPGIQMWPSWDLINAYKDGLMSYAAFSERFQNYLDGYTSSGQLHDELERISKEYGCTNLILLCWEKTGCHRTALAAYIGKDYCGEL